MEIIIIRQKISFKELVKIVLANYGEMAKGVVDLERGVIALGGKMHADAEQYLLEDGANQEKLWGFNIHIKRPQEKRLEYTSLINIRPNDKNYSMNIQNSELRERIRQLVDQLIEEND